jgi:RNA polymerase sigma-70 factor (ECF subfamily)
VLALLTRRFGDLDLADDAVQDALAEAVRTWPVAGVPSNPAAWLLQVARRKAIDHLRRTSSAYRRTMAAAPQLTGLDEPIGREHLLADDDEVTDDHLRLVLLCCHPALDRATQVALTLRLVGGLSTDEIAAAFLVPEATLAQRIVRAKRKIREAHIPLSIPADLEGRVDALLAVLYLVFNEGYLSRSDHENVVRIDLVDEAVRLTELAIDLLPDSAEARGLLAMELYHRARLATRLDLAGELVLLEQQDRTRWDLPEIRRANAVLHDALQRMQPGPYQVQAIIAGHHANARTADDTDWSAIAALYRQLASITGSPVVLLNHAVAVAMADGPNAGLALLDTVNGLDDYHLFHAARGELLLRAGDTVSARAAFVGAVALTANPAEQRHLERRLQACSTTGA